MSESISVSAKCPSCGTTITWPDDATEETILVCSKCVREVGTYGEFKKEAMVAVSGKVQGMLKDIFKRR